MDEDEIVITSLMAKETLICLLLTNFCPITICIIWNLIRCSRRLGLWDAFLGAFICQVQTYLSTSYSSCIFLSRWSCYPTQCISLNHSSNESFLRHCHELGNPAFCFNKTEFQIMYPHWPSHC